MMSILRDFISKEKRDFKFKMGNILASALTGFVVGAIVALIIYLVGYFIYLV